MDDFLYWYNLGTVQLHLGQYPDARYSLEKAQLETLFSRRTSHQLSLVEEKIDRPTPPEKLVDHLNLGLLYLGPLKLWFLALLIVLPIVWLIKVQAPRLVLGLYGLLGLIPVGLALWFQMETGALVALKPIELYDGPSKIFLSGRNIAPGTKVLVREREGWWYVVSPSSASGWIPSTPDLRNGQLWGLE